MSQIMTSNCIFANDVNIDNATPVVTGSGTSISLELGLSDTADGVYTWEAVALGLQHVFVATGKFLKWRATGTNYTVTEIQVQVNT